MANLLDNDLISKYESEFNLTYTEISQKIDTLETENDVGMLFGSTSDSQLILTPRVRPAKEALVERGKSP